MTPAVLSRRAVPAAVGAAPAAGRAGAAAAAEPPRAAESVRTRASTWSVTSRLLSAASIGEFGPDAKIIV